MTKPVIVKRLTKGSPLTYAEQDQNFQNLRDATISLRAGTSGTTVVSDLNGVITLVDSASLRFIGDDTLKTIEIRQNRYHVNTTVAGGVVSADYSLGNLQRITTTDSLTVAAPTNMTPGDELKIIVIVTTLGSSATVGFSGILINDNSQQNYFEIDNTVTFTTGAGNLIVTILYDGTDYWGTVNTNYV